MNYTCYSVDSAPETTQSTLLDIQKSYGFVPNLYAYLAESPVALNAYLHINEQLMTKSSLKPAEVQLALLTISVVNGCEFCIAAHSWGCERTQVDADTVLCVRENRQVTNSRDAALVTFVQSLVLDRGYVPEPIQQQLFNAGFSNQNLFDLLVCNMLKSLSNYANHITHTEVNPELIKYSR